MLDKKKDSNWPNLDNPPIILSVIEVRFRLPDGYNVKSLKKNDVNIRRYFPTRQENYAGNIDLPVPDSGEMSAKVSSKLIGYTYINNEKTKKVVITKENFLYITEDKYSGWINFKKEFLKYLNLYKDILNISLIERLSMRYVNRIKIEGINSPLDYFNTTISARDGVINYPINAYFFKFVMEIPETTLKANVIQSLEKQDIIIFDIDVLSYDTAEFKDYNFKDNLEELRNLKNEIFFKNITKKTIKLL